MDSSKDIRPSDLNLQKEYIKYMARLLNTKKGKSRATVVSYGDSTNLLQGFDYFTSYEDFAKEFDLKSSPIGGERRADNALKVASDLFEDARNDVPKVILFITGGKQSRAGQPLQEIAKRIRGTGVNIFVMSVGPNVDYSVLRPVVQNQQDLVNVPSFEKLKHSADELVQHIVRRKPWL